MGSTKTRITRTRRVRRQQKAALKNGKSAKPSHRLKAGRTGSVHAKKRRGGGDGGG